MRATDSLSFKAAENPNVILKNARSNRSKLVLENIFNTPKNIKTFVK